MRAEAKRRTREVLPQLRAAIRAAKYGRKHRETDCKREARNELAALHRRAKKARASLRARVAKLETRLRDSVKACRTAGRTEQHAELERALDALRAEREAIAELKRQARAVRSDKGRKGGQRAAEKRAESDEDVERELPNDDAWREAWRKLRARIKATPHRSRAEAFFEYIHDHPHELDEARARKEREYEADAERLFEELQHAQATEGHCPRAHHATLDECRALLEKDAANLPF